MVVSAQRCIGEERQLPVLATKDSRQRCPSYPPAVIVLGGWLGVNAFQQNRLQEVTESRPTNWFRRHERGIPRLDRERQLPVLS
jgi:hypothetical protein